MDIHNLGQRYSKFGQLDNFLFQWYIQGVRIEKFLSNLKLGLKLVTKIFVQN